MLYAPVLSEHGANFRKDPTTTLSNVARSFLDQDHQRVLAKHKEQHRFDQLTSTTSRLPCTAGTLPTLLLHTIHRRFLYVSLVTHNIDVAGTDVDYLYKLFDWCASNNVFIHPALEVRKCVTAFRDLAFFVNRPMEKFAPIFAIPERLLIGFMDADDASATSSLLDVRKEKEFNEANNATDSDVCDFFFASLGLVVSDLVMALNSKLTDSRWRFASSLNHTRTLQNAPYLPDNVHFGSDDVNLADVLLQMIRNYVNGGPLTGKVDRADLLWAVSVCLSHSTPLSIAYRKSIGIVPMVHLFPHGGKKSNATVFGRMERKNSASHMANYFAEHHNIDFSVYDATHYTAQFVEADKKRWSDARLAQHGKEMERLEKTCSDRQSNLVYVVPTERLAGGSEVHMQAMAPVCDKEEQSDHMWKLSCGSVPEDSLPSSDVAKTQKQTRKEIATTGSKCSLMQTMEV